MIVQPSTKPTTTKAAKPTKQVAPRVIKPNPDSRLAKVTSKAKEAAAKQAATKPKPQPANDVGILEAMKQSRRKLTMSSDALNLIREGITRDKLKLHLMERWGLTEAKKWYVNWYFAHAKRKGIKTCECDLAPKPKK